MLVEEDKRAKELASKPKIKGGDDEPDWQNVSKTIGCSFGAVTF